MSVEIKIPTPLRKFTQGQSSVEVEATSVGAALEALEAIHPGLLTKIIDDKGKVRRFINVYAGDDDIRFLEGLQTELSAGAELSIIPAIAGGR
ncbi:MAG TPA: molybdopterin synthase sulfur carrier subunit [Myxococcales bacterium]|nr:molybdopterin synthase sulfur carrier subunit [Myxococcales bacterium]